MNLKILCLSLLIATSASAVAISPGDGSGNTSPPGVLSAAWFAFCRFDDGAGGSTDEGAWHIEDGWFLAPENNLIAPTTGIRCAGTLYPTVETYQLDGWTDIGGTDQCNIATNLRLRRVSPVPSVPTVPVAQISVETGDVGYLVGAGARRTANTLPGPDCFINDPPWPLLQTPFIEATTDHQTRWAENRPEIKWFTIGGTITGCPCPPTGTTAACVGNAGCPLEQNSATRIYWDPISDPNALPNEGIGLPEGDIGAGFMRINSEGPELIGLNESSAFCALLTSPVDAAVYDMNQLIQLPAYYNQIQDIIADTDSDGVRNWYDNCKNHANAGQQDADGDDIGNRCDPDFDQNGIVGGSDFVTLQACFGSHPPISGGPASDLTCEESDLDSNGVVGSSDYIILRAFFGMQNGPAGTCG